MFSTELNDHLLEVGGLKKEQRKVVWFRRKYYKNFNSFSLSETLSY